MDNVGKKSGRVRLKIMVDNYVCQSGVVGEHGFSCLVCDDDYRLLFDTGASDAIVKNAEVMGVDIGSVDVVVLSHGHNDHSGGLASVLERNNHCVVYGGEGVESNRIGKRKIQIGMPSEALIKERGNVILRGVSKMSDRVYAVCADATALRGKAHIDGFFLTDEEGKAVRADEFGDEVYLAIEHGEWVSVVTGCAHRGITNILEAVCEVFKKPVHTVLGGMHTVRDSVQEIDALVCELRKYSPRRVVCCHCTGVNAFAQLKYDLGETEVICAEVGNDFFLDV